MKKFQTSRYQCKECFYRAISEDALIRHITKNHTKQTAARLHCELCDFVSTKKTELSKHLQKNHRGEKAYVCETCGKKFQVVYVIYLPLKNPIKPKRFFSRLTKHWKSITKSCISTRNLLHATCAITKLAKRPPLLPITTQFMRNRNPTCVNTVATKQPLRAL
jgi:hypothetical protein